MSQYLIFWKTCNLNRDTFVGKNTSSTNRDCRCNVLGMSERSELSSVDNTENVLLVYIKITSHCTIQPEKYLILWWTYTFNR